MPRKIICRLLCALLALVAFETIHAQGTAFLYQGRLNDGGSPATGNYDLRFAIYDAVTNGNAISFPLTNSATAVSNGLFTATLDIGAGIFTGTNYWLQIGVQTNGLTNAFIMLFPRQPVLPVPYAIFANSASNLLGTLTGNGSGFTNILITSLTSDGIAGAFSGQVVTLKSDGTLTLSNAPSGGGGASLPANLVTNILSKPTYFIGLGDSTTVGYNSVSNGTSYIDFLALIITNNGGNANFAGYTNCAISGTTALQWSGVYYTNYVLANILAHSSAGTNVIDSDWTGFNDLVGAESDVTIITAISNILVLDAIHGAKTLLWTIPDRFNFANGTYSQAQDELFRNNINNWIRQQVMNTNVIGIVDDAALYPLALNGSATQPDGVHFITPIYYEFAVQAYGQLVSPHLISGDNNLGANQLNVWNGCYVNGGITCLSGGISSSSYISSTGAGFIGGSFSSGSYNGPANMVGGLYTQGTASATVGASGWTNNLGMNCAVTLTAGTSVVEYNYAGTPEWTNTFTTPFQFRVQAGGWFNGTSIVPIGQAWAW
jgi:hypothetical protein